MNNKIVILEKDKEYIDVIKTYIEESGDFILDNSFDDYTQGMTYIKDTKPQMVLLSEISNSTDMNLVEEIANMGINVVVLSSNYTTTNIIKILRAGAKEILTKPVIKKDLLCTLDKCSQGSVKALDKSNIISVFSNKGGIGKTTIATNLAIELARQSREKTVLVDLNLPLGDITTFMNIKPSISIVSAIENTTHNNESILNACKQYKDTSLYVLAEPVYMEENHSITPANITKLFQHLRETFSYIIVDLGTNIDKMNMKILELSDKILLISIINLPLIRNCQRCLDLFNNLGFDENKTKIIINRYLENDEITIQDAEKVLHQNIYWKIPNNYFAIMSAINKAMPVSELNMNSNVTLSFNGLAAKLTEDIIKNKFIN